MAVPGILDRFHPPASGASEQRFKGSALSEVKGSLGSAGIQSDAIVGNCYGKSPAEGHS